MNKFIQLLKNPPNWLVFVLILVALGVRFEYIMFNFPFHTDEQYQILSTLYLEQGKGVVLSYADTTDVSKSIQVPFNRPAGYNYMILPLLKVTNNIYWSIVLFKFIGILALALSWFLIFYYTKGYISNQYLIPLIIILGFNNYPYMDYGTSDLLSIAFYWLSFSLSIGIFYSNRKFLCSLLTGIFLFGTYFLRYAYYPIVFIFLFSLFVIIILEDKSKLKYFFVTLFTFLILVFVNITKYAFTLNDNAPKVFYFENVLSFNFLFPIQGLIDERIFYTFLHRLQMDILIIPIKLFLSIFVVAVISIGLIKLIYKLFKTKQIDKENYLWILPITTSGITLAMLLFLSLTTPQQNTDLIQNWTFVKEIRYFAPVFMSILFLIIYLGFHDKELSENTRIKNYLKYILFLSAFICFIYIIPNKYSEYKSNKNYFKTGESRLFIQTLGSNEDGKLLQSLIKQSTINEIRPIYITTDQTKIIAEILGAEFGGSIIDKKWEKLKTSKDVIFIFKLTENSYFKEQEEVILNFCNTKAVKQTNFKNLNIYTFKLKANI